MIAIIKILTYFVGHGEERLRAEVLNYGNDSGTSGDKYDLDQLAWLEDSGILGSDDNAAWFKLARWKREGR